MTALFALLLATTPLLDGFDEPLDPRRWYIGTPAPPKNGALRLPRKGWIVSRSLPEEGVERVEVRFHGRGGTLAVVFHGDKEPLSNPLGPALRVPRGRGERVLVVTAGGATVDGEPIEFAGSLRPTFMLRAERGAIDLLEVRVAPRPPDPEELSELEKRTVHGPTTPPRFRLGEGEAFSRTTILLWDAEVALLVRRGKTAFELLAAPPKGSPVLGVLLTLGDGRALAKRAGSHPLAMRDWGDERGNLAPGRYRIYLAQQYAIFEVLLLAQRALNARLPPRKGIEALEHLAVIRHTDNPQAACALAETQGAKGALKALRKALGRGVELERASPDRIRAAAAAAACAVLGAPPAEWPGFRFDPQSRFVTMQAAKDLVR